MHHFLKRTCAFLALGAAGLSLTSCDHPPTAASTPMETRVSSEKGAALLGWGYDRHTEGFTSKCAMSRTPIRYAGTPTSSLTFNRDLTYEQMKTKFGLQVSGKAMLPTFNLSGGSRFAIDAASTDLSSSLVINYDVRGRQAILEEPELTPNVRSTVSTWDPQIIRAQCGDAFVDSVELGARLLVSVRFDFSNADLKTDFDANIKLDFVSLFEVEGAAQVAFEKFKDQVTVTITATQIGGSVAKLTNILGATGTDTHVIKCGLANRDACESALQSILKYARDDFSAQLENLDYNPNAPGGAAFLSYGVKDYYAGGMRELYPNPGPVLAQEVKETRDRLFDTYQAQAKDRAYADSLLRMPSLSTEERDTIQGINDILRSNVGKLVNTAQICYDTPGRCVAADGQMLLTKYDPAKLSHLEVFLDFCQREIRPKAVTKAIDEIKKTLNIPDGETNCRTIYDELVNEAALDLSSRELSDLKVLRKLPGLTELDLSNNKILNVSALSTLPGLKVLNLRDNSISNMAPLAKLTQLESLDLVRNRLIDVTSLAALTNLKVLKMQGNSNVHDFAPALGLRQLTTRLLSYDDICKQERDWALQSGQINRGSYAEYASMNFAPIYFRPMERASGVTGWIACEPMARQY